MALADVAQKILNHVATGPAETPGQRVRNTFSPHMERLITELIRGHLIKSVQAIESDIALEFDLIRTHVADDMKSSFDAAAARITENLRSLYKTL